MCRAALVLLVACGHPAGSGPDPRADATAPDACGAPSFDVPIAALTAHNTSASPAYDRAHFAANFGGTTWVSQGGTTIQVDPAAADMSLNPVTPGHVSAVDVHTLIPNRPDLRWFAHSVPWFHTGGGNHIDIGLDSASAGYVKSMIDDMRRRGFDGIVIDWYGQGSYEDQATRLVQRYLATISGFSLVIMIDKGVPNLAGTLPQQIAYLKTQYFQDPAYEHEGAKPILMFFGVDPALLSRVKPANLDQVWVTEGTGGVGDQDYDWAHVYVTGPSATDPYNLQGVGAYYAAVAASGKRAFGAMTGGFNGTLTRSVAWSEGKYLPRGDGRCLVAWANKIASVIPSNVTRMQWVTWSDWEEGSAVEPGVENGVKVTASRAGTTLAWTTTGPEATIDHYEVYATVDGVTAADLGRPTGHTFELACGLDGAKLAVVAVGKPMIRDHVSQWTP